MKKIIFLLMMVVTLTATSQSIKGVKVGETYDTRYSKNTTVFGYSAIVYPLLLENKEAYVIIADLHYELTESQLEDLEKRLEDAFGVELKIFTNIKNEYVLVGDDGKVIVVIDSEIKEYSELVNVTKNSWNSITQKFEPKTTKELQSYYKYKVSITISTFDSHKKHEEQVDNDI